MKRFLKIIFRTVLVLFILVNIITAFHAYKFTHFYDRDEVTVKKQDKKSGWDITKDALFGVKAVKLKNTISPDSSFQTVYLKTKNGLKLEAWYIPVNNAVGTVCLFHGHGGTRSGVFKESEEFRKMGYNTLLLDFRAHGNSEGNTCTIGYNETEDVKLAYDHISGKGEKNIVLWGISMGAATVSKAIYDYNLQPAKLILEMPFGSILDAAEGRLRSMKLPPEPLATLITFWGGTERGFWAFSMKPTEYVKKINCPVLLQCGGMDPRVTRAEIETIYNNIHTVKKLVVYETAGHESLCKKENEKWNNAIKAFLQ